MKIGFFDSGVGGISVLYQALKVLPAEDYLYYADTDHVPYGEKSTEQVRQYVAEAVDFIAAQRVKALVLACNSATSAMAVDARSRYDFPIIGIEPAVKPALSKAHSEGRRVLVMATRLTLKEEKFAHLVAELDGEGVVDRLPLPGLVKYAEQLEFNQDILIPYFQEQLSAFDLCRYDTVVLGCTHFPLYRDILQKVLAPGTDIIDGGAGTARNLQRILTERNQVGGGSGNIDYYASGVKVEDSDTLQRYTLLLKRMRDMEAAL
ncbi:MAG TPA: glutamate racemase [Patescibacteria group bacterium]|nr:glutamate racemase [Patescibacteria group bacterium]